jgi:hypothetical protein
MTYKPLINFQIKFHMHRSRAVGVMVGVIKFVEGPEGLVKV